VIRLLAAALALALLALGVQTNRLADAKLDAAEQLATAEHAARTAIEAARTEEQRRTAEVQKAADEAHKSLARARADADAAADAGRRLRERIAAATAGCRAATGDPSAASSGEATDATSDLLADVQRRLDEAADGIARFADHAATAGRACERGYDALGYNPAARQGLSRLGQFINP